VTVYLSLKQVLALHRLQVTRFGGAAGLRDGGALEAAVARPRMTFGGEDLYPDVPAKAAALMHSLVANHPFVDGNKRVGAHAGIQLLLVNGFETAFTPAALTRITMAVARGEVSGEALAVWFRQRTRERED
jgi:death on curing protein